MRGSRLLRFGLLLLALPVASGLAQASPPQRVERKLAIDPDASIRIYNLNGSVRVEGWDRDTISVVATIGDPLKNRFFFGGGTRGAKMGIESPLDLDQAPAHLIVKVPNRSRVWIKAATASIDLSGLQGGVDVSSTSGNIRFEGSPDQLNLETMDGSIEVIANGPWMRAKTASGTITLRGGGEDVGATTVSGDVTLLSSGMRRVRMETVSGKLNFSGALARDGALTVESHSGPVDLLLPADLSAEFDLSTYEGTITNGFAPERRPTRQGAGEELHITALTGSANINVRTFKGPIVLRKK
ncbi:MAG: DUF4097 family beta strand repeat-containing protein [Gemmatimonadota bacterium]